jgi:hypothetical protein
VLGFKDEVRGFDADENFVDPMEHLDIYKEFLGEAEFEQVKCNYQKTMETMEMVYKLELERLKISDGLQEELQERDLV